MKAEDKAKSAIAELTKERDDAVADSKRYQRTISQLQGAVESARRQLVEMERRLYWRGVSAINSLYGAEMRTDHWSSARLLTLHIVPKMASSAIPAEHLLDARSSMDIVSEHIDQLVKFHSNDLKTQLRECAWKAAEFASYERRR